MKLIRSWLLPLLVAIGLFFVTRPAFAQIVEPKDISLSEYLLTGNIAVGEETVDGYRQVYYQYQGNNNYITGGGSNSHSPVSNGQYIVYLKDINGAPQVFFYNILTNSEIKLSSTESNNAPYVSKEGNVVWEGWVDEVKKWQVFLFDGKSVTQLTNGDLAINPYIEGDMVVYARRDIAGEWKSTLYSMRSKSEKDITVGNKTQYTKLRGGRIVFELPGKTGEEFTLTAQDLFTLDLAPLSSTESANLVQDTPSTVTVDDVLQELEAVPVATEAGSMN